MQSNCTTPRKPRQRIPLEVRFWAKVDKSGGPDACWPWMGARTTDQYGRMYVHPGYDYAHHVAYTLAYGPIPAGLFVLHSCDEPPCMNAAHLFIGTQGDNLRDCAAKGRNVAQAHPELIVRGERVGTAKLTPCAVKAIRGLHAQGVSLTACGRRYGVSRTTVRRIVDYDSWRHVL